MANKKAVILDLYGTLIYLANETKAYAKLFAQLGLQNQIDVKQARRIALTEDFEGLAGFITRIKQDANLDIQEYEDMVQKELLSAALYPETMLVLEELRNRNIKLGLISNLASPYKKPFFSLGLDNYFEKVLFSCEIGLMKPDKKIYQMMIDYFAINPSDALMAGDKIYADVDGPQSIGIQAVHLDRNNNYSKSINRLDGILNYI